MEINKTYPAIKCTGEIIHFQTLYLPKFPMCSTGLNMGIISSTTHTKTFNFLPGTGEHFNGNSLYSSDESVTQLIHIWNFPTINNAFCKPAEEKIQRSQIWRIRGPGNG
jgi:hypothetical protein